VCYLNFFITTFRGSKNALNVYFIIFSGGKIYLVSTLGGKIKQFPVVLKASEKIKKS